MTPDQITKKEYPQIVVRVPLRVKQIVESIADENGTTPSKLVRRFLQEGIDAYGR